MDYSKIIVKRVQDVPPSGIRKYFDLLNDETISLGVGEPDFPHPSVFVRKRWKDSQRAEYRIPQIPYARA